MVDKQQPIINKDHKDAANSYNPCYSNAMALGLSSQSKCEGSSTSDQHLKEYEEIEQLLSQPKPDPVSLTAKSAAIEAYDHLRCHHYVNEAEQLVNLLAKPHIKSLLLCHDSIANKVYGPVLPELSLEVDEDDVTVKVVNLIKKDEPLGATIKINERNGAVLIARVMHGGSADRSNAIDVGDEIQEINGVAVRGRDPMEVIRMLTTISGHVKLKLAPSCVKRNQNEQNQDFQNYSENESGQTNPIKWWKMLNLIHHQRNSSIGELLLATMQQMVHIRALFSYSPSSDPLTPCPEAGLAFLKGEILRLVNSEDPNWWQAIKVEFSLNGPVSSVLSGNMTQPGLGRAGLIPSKTMREWKIQYHFGSLNSSGGQDNPNGESLSYEEVERYFPEEGCYRPIVLIGPSGVGKSELVRQLISTDPEHFREPIRITTREPRPGELHGVDYLFVTRDEFNTFLEADSLIDQTDAFGESTTGLCLDAVLEIIHAGQVAVFEADYRNLMQLRTASLKPFIVFVKPPSLDILMETRQIPRLSPSNSILGDSTNIGTLSPARSVPTTPRMSARTAGCFAQITPTRNCQLWKKSGHSSPVASNDLVSSVDNLRMTDTQRKCIFSDAKLHEMLQVAARLEVTHGHLWDYVLVNDDLPVALEQLSELAYRIETEAFWVPQTWVSSNENQSSDMNGTTAPTPPPSSISMDINCGLVTTSA